MPACLALSTIQVMSCGQEMPAHLACSGTSDSGVMPGWVLISSTTRPPVPGLDRPSGSRRASAPLQPSAWCAVSAHCLGQLVDLGRDRRRHEMLGDAVGIFGLVVVEAVRGRSSVTASGSSPITATVSSRPGTKCSTSTRSPNAASATSTAARLSPSRTMCTPTLEPSVDRLHHIGPRHRIARGQRLALDHLAFGDAHAERGEDVRAPSACPWRCAEASTPEWV